MTTKATIWGNDNGPVPHIIKNAQGAAFPSRLYLRFVNMSVQDNADETVVTANMPAKGDPGPIGPPGPFPTLKAGTVTTVPSGLPATVTIRPDPAVEGQYLLDLGIPEGPQGTIASITAAAETLPPGSDATAAITPDGVGYLLTLGLPQGEDGAAKVSVGSTTTGNAGTNANVVGSADPNDVTALILSFTIPRGTTFTPSVSSAGEITWTNDGGLSNPAPQDITGPSGPAGPRPSFVAGTVTTVDYGGAPSVTLTQTAPGTYRMDLVTVTGPKGEQGEPSPAEWSVGP